ncbi:MAG: DUF4352 domain-containing protein [Acidobacteria bacterium]|nr:DUF4352 domain-containing protein [Acidobacteriota bacterium]
MKQNCVHLQARRRFVSLFLTAPAVALGLVSCGKRANRALSFAMGERASVGKLIYVASETEWKTSLGEGPTAKVPQNRFLLIKISVTNGGGAPIAVPLLSLYDANGKQFRESDEVEGLPQWLGALRMLGPVETKQGYTVFDVPPASYKLQITDAGDLESEILAYIDVPLRMEANPVLAEPSALQK